MQEKRVIGPVLTTLSMAAAVTILALLLLLATSPSPEQYRKIDGTTAYLTQAVDAVGRGIAVSESQTTPIAEEVAGLDQALDLGSTALARVVRQVYQPVDLLSQARRPAMQWLNLIDTQAGELSDPHTVLGVHRAIQTGIERIQDQLVVYSGTQQELLSAFGTFDEATNSVVSGFREARQQDLADNVYVNAQQVRRLVHSGSSDDLDQVLSIVVQLQQTQSSVGAAERGNLQLLVDSIYTMTSLRRSLNQAVATMDQAGLDKLTGTFRTFTTEDQLYVLKAVNDARVLLNIYTVLLLAVLAFFGLRLRASHRALNRSHEDLEVRVEERTADLAQANEDLKESQVQLVQAEKMSSLGQLVAGVMHEINTPLLYVLNNTTVTAEAVADLQEFMALTLPVLKAQNSEQGKDAIKQILAQRQQFDANDLEESMQEIGSLAHDSVDGLNQISELVQSLKDFSRLDRVADDTFDVREGIEKTLTITRNMLKYGIEVVKDFQPVPEIYCSPSRLNQVFINLVTNATQAMDGEGKLTISTRHVVSGEQESVEVAFEDTGCGIPEEHLSQIMDPFFTTKPVGQGTGLGLSIVHQIIDQHGGQIYIDSKVGHGTRIVLSFPVGAPAQQSDDDNEEAA